MLIYFYETISEEELETMSHMLKQISSKNLCTLIIFDNNFRGDS